MVLQPASGATRPVLAPLFRDDALSILYTVDDFNSVGCADWDVWCSNDATELDADAHFHDACTLSHFLHCDALCHNVMLHPYLSVIFSYPTALLNNNSSDSGAGCNSNHMFILKLMDLYGKHFMLTNKNC